MRDWPCAIMECKEEGQPNKYCALSVEGSFPYFRVGMYLCAEHETQVTHGAAEYALHKVDWQCA